MQDLGFKLRPPQKKMINSRSRYLNLSCGIVKIVVRNYHDNIMIFKKDNYEFLIDFDFYIFCFFIK